MKGEARKAALATYKEREVVGGVYLVHCAASGEMWVGQWPDISTIQARLWFTLRQGTIPNKNLLEAWHRYGEALFTFEILERLEEETPSYIRTANLREMASHWREKLGADSL